MMTPDQYEAIGVRLANARDRYYANGDSGMTDDEYDLLKQEYVTAGYSFREMTNLHENPETRSQLVVRPHLSRMESIGVCVRNVDELMLAKKFIGGDTVLVSLKYDGLSCELIYAENGQLEHALLRGDGDSGEDIVHNAKWFKGVPHELIAPVPKRRAVKGEIVISWNNLKVLNELREEDGHPPYKTPRNAVSSVRRLLARSQEMSLFTFKAFDRYPREGQYDQRRILKPLQERFQVVDVQEITYEDAWSSLMAMAADRETSIQYQIDGLVIRSPDIPEAMAKLKFPAQSAITTITEVVEQLGRTGIVSPVAKFKPVNLGGVTVQRATVHNIELVNRELTGLGVGATVMVSRRGDVIPHVESVLAQAVVPWLPRQDCPSCGAEVIQDNSTRRCSADPSECSGTQIGLLTKFCKTVGIDGVGPAMAAALVAYGKGDPADLYTTDVSELSEIPTFNGKIGEATAQKIYRSVHTHAEMSFGQLLGALGIRGCAVEVMESVTDWFPDPEQWPSIVPDDLTKIPGIGPERAHDIVDFVFTRWEEIVVPLLSYVALIGKTDGPLSGMTFCITLELKSGSRPEVEARIKTAGGRVKSSVTKEVTHLVCNFADAGTSKHKRATDLGIPIISEDRLVEMMGSWERTDKKPTEADPF